MWENCRFFGSPQRLEQSETEVDTFDFLSPSDRGLGLCLTWPTPGSRWHTRTVLHQVGDDLFGIVKLTRRTLSLQIPSVFGSACHTRC